MVFAIEKHRHVYSFEYHEKAYVLRVSLDRVTVRHHEFGLNDPFRREPVTLE